MWECLILKSKVNITSQNTGSTCTYYSNRCSEVSVRSFIEKSGVNECQGGHQHTLPLLYRAVEASTIVSPPEPGVPAYGEQQVLWLTDTPPVSL